MKERRRVKEIVNYECGKRGAVLLERKRISREFGME